MTDPLNARSPEPSGDAGPRGAAPAAALADYLYDVGPAGIVLYEPTPPFRVLATNRAYQELWPEPLRSRGLVGLGLAEYVPDAERTGIVEIFRGVARTGVTRSLQEFPYDGFAGGRRWFNWTVAPVLRHGRVAALAHMAVDVTREVLARKEAERAVAESRHGAELLELGDPFCELDRDFRIIRVNAAHERINGHRREQILGRTHWDVWPESADPSSSYWREYHRCVEERVRVEFDAYYAPLDVWTSVIAYPTSEGGVAIFWRDATERKRAEVALRDSEEKLRVSFAQAAIGFALATPDGRFLEVNDAFRTITGYGLDELRSMSFRELVHPDDLAANLAQNERMVSGEIPGFVVENRYRRKGGEVIWVRKSVSVVRSAGGEPKWISVLVENVTDRKLAEEALRASEARQAYLVRLGDTLRALSDADEIQEHACRLLAEYLGVDRAYYVAIEEQAGVAHVARDHVREGVRSLAGTHRLSDFGWVVPALRRGETLVVSDVASDARIPVSERPAYAALEVAAHVSVPLVKAGALVGAFSVTKARPRTWSATEIEVVRETAERVWSAIIRARSETALREREARLRAFIESDVIGVVFGDVDGRVHDCNEEFARIIGRSREDVLAGKVRWTDITPPEDLPLDEAAVAEGRATGRCLPYEKHFIRPDGTRVPAHVGFVLLEPDRTRSVGFILDITERKAADEALRQSDQRKAEFLAVLSHELRNPLAPIRNSMYLLERAPADSEQARRAREVIRRQTDHLTRLVDDLLDMTRISHGKVGLKIQRIDLRDVTRKAMEDARTLFERTGVELLFEIGPGPVWIDADPTRIAQVIGNILHNAQKFTPAGGVVTTRLEVHDGTARVRIKDSGVGIEPGREPSMFEPFTQGEQSMARTKGGLGLGLSLVKSLVELHGGSVAAHSEGIGRGTEFVIAFPLAPSAGVPRRGTADARLRPRDVVLVEDNEDAAQTLADILALDGHRVRIASDARSGLAVARDEPPDVILCDIGLPDVDGYEFARMARGDPVLAGVRLVALTGYAQPDDRERAKRAGFDDHLAKPPDPEELARVLSGGR